MWKTAPTIFLIFGMKLLIHSGKKVTRPDFPRKILILRKSAKSPKKWGFWHFFENWWPYIIFVHVLNAYFSICDHSAKTRSKNMHFHGWFRVLTAVNMRKITFSLFCMVSKVHILTYSCIYDCFWPFYENQNLAQ